MDRDRRRLERHQQRDERPAASAVLTVSTGCTLTTLPRPPLGPAPKVQVSLGINAENPMQRWAARSPGARGLLTAAR